MGTHTNRTRTAGVAWLWLAGSIVSAVCVVWLLIWVLQGKTWLLAPAGFSAILLWTFAAQQFAETHRRHYHRWQRAWLFWTGTPERRALVDAWTHRDPDAAVEASRLIGLALEALALAAVLLLFAASSSNA